MLTLVSCGKPDTEAAYKKAQSPAGDDSAAESTADPDKDMPEEEEDTGLPFSITVTDKDTIYVEVPKVLMIRPGQNIRTMHSSIFDIFDCVELKEYNDDSTYGERYNRTELLERSVDEDFVWMPMGAWSSDTGLYVSK